MFLNINSGFYPSSFVYSRFSSKIWLTAGLVQYLFYLLYLRQQIDGKCISNTLSECRSMDFSDGSNLSYILKSFMGSFEEKLTTTFLYAYLNGKFSKVFLT